MYPRNAASPERIAVGAVVLIADGTVQTSGVSISVRGQGGASGAGGGTTDYDNGIVEYTPTQAETNFTSFVVTAYKTGCIPTSITVVTVAGTTAGKATLETDQAVNVTKINGTSQTARDIGASVLLAASQHVIVDSGTVTTLTNLPAVPTDWLTAAGVKADAVTKIQSGLATPTNITAGTITTVTNLTNAPGAGDFTATMKTSLNAATPASVQNISAQTGDSYARLGAAGAGLTALGDARIANLDAAVSSRSTYAGGAVASVTGAVGSVTAPVSLAGDLTATMKTSVTTAATAATPTVSVNTSAIASAVAGAISVPTVGQIDTQLTSSHGAGAWGASAAGAGSKAVTITVEINGAPLDGVMVWATTDEAGVHVSAGVLATDAFGVVNFLLDPGTYYVWKQHSGYNFTNPDTITVT